MSTVANSYLEHVQGQYNVISSASATAWNATGNALIIGNGTGTRSNSFRTTNDGRVYGRSAYNSTGADYAELFEWLDKNPDAEDRIGCFVTLERDKIRIATDKDTYILGVISGNPTVLGNNYGDVWKGMYLTDEWGRVLFEEVEVKPEYHEVDGQKVLYKEGGIEKRMKLNPKYRENRKYIPREDRPVWDAVGMLGQLLVRHDGTCKVNGYCKPNAAGIATAAEEGYRVLAVRGSVVKIVFR